MHLLLLVRWTELLRLLERARLRPWTAVTPVRLRARWRDPRRQAASPHAAWARLQPPAPAFGSTGRLEHSTCMRKWHGQCIARVRHCRCCFEAGAGDLWCDAACELGRPLRLLKAAWTTHLRRHHHRLDRRQAADADPCASRQVGAAKLVRRGVRRLFPLHLPTC